MAVNFIPDEIVLLVHADLIRRYGGQTGIVFSECLEASHPAMVELARKAG